ncbi:MAG TPA: TonB-dependent receptor, partial [Thermoanaerobaculia bacterium]
MPGKAFGEINVTGLTDIGTDRNNPKSFFQDLYQLSDNVSVWSGPHAFRVGFNAERFDYEANSESRTRGQLRFRSLEDFLRGRARDFTLSRPGSDFARDLRQDLFAVYVQDDFHAAARLTINAGLRWEFVTTPKERNGKIANLRSVTDSTVTVGDPLFQNPTKKNLAPRIGFAWDASGDGKTAVRGGFGIFYEQPLFYEFRSPMFRSLPFVERVRITNPSLPIQLASLGSAGPPDTESFQYDVKPAYVEQYNVNVQRELSPIDTVVSVGYFGSHGVNLFGQGDVNTAIPQILSDGTEFFPANAPRRNPNFGIVRAIFQGFSSHYNGLHAAIARRATRGFQFQASYAYGKCVDNRSGAGGREEFTNGQARTFDPYHLDRDEGRCDYDVRHTGAINASYDLPLGKGKLVGGWQVSGIVMYGSGVPFTPIIAGDPDRDATDDNAARPNRVSGCDPEKVPGGRGPDAWFNAACFSFPTPGTRGNAGRNSLNGPDFKEISVAL